MARAKAKVCTSAFLAEKGLRLTRCERQEHEEGEEYPIDFRIIKPGTGMVAVAELWASPSLGREKPKLTIGYIEVKEEVRKGGVGTALYEAMLAEACSMGADLLSDDHRSPFAEAFWRKQARKERAVCIPGEGGTEYTVPMRELQRDLKAGKVTQAAFDEMTKDLPVPIDGMWPCERFEITKPCDITSLRGLRGLRGMIPAAGDPALVKAFRKAANMTPDQIKAWAKNPTAKCASLPKRSKTGKSAITELAQVARMKTSSPSSWSASDWRKARDLVAFVGRHAAKKAPGDRCATKRVVALRNWAHQPAGCPVPTSCAPRRRR